MGECTLEKPLRPEQQCVATRLKAQYWLFWPLSDKYVFGNLSYRRDTLKQLEAEGRSPVGLAPDEQLTLAHYSDCGDTEVFNHTLTQISDYVAGPCGKLKGLFTQEEIDSLHASTLNAHTPSWV